MYKVKHLEMALLTAVVAFISMPQESEAALVYGCGGIPGDPEPGKIRLGCSIGSTDPETDEDIYESIGTKVISAYAPGGSGSNNNWTDGTVYTGASQSFVFACGVGDYFVWGKFREDEVVFITDDWGPYQGTYSFCQ